MQTQSKKHTIFDVTEILPGRMIPNDFVQLTEDGNKPYFYMPSTWDEENHWGMNRIIAMGRKFPVAYSPGYSTPEEALNAAEEWESGEQERLQTAANNYAALFGDTMKAIRLF